MFYNYYSSNAKENTGFSTAKYLQLFFVQDDDNEVWLLVLLDGITGSNPSPVDRHVYWKIKSGGVAAGRPGNQKTYIVLMDDCAEPELGSKCALKTAADSSVNHLVHCAGEPASDIKDCAAWNEDTGVGSMGFKWKSDESDGLSMGPLPADSFWLDFEFPGLSEAGVPYTHYRVNSFNAATNALEHIDFPASTSEERARFRQIRVDGHECSAYCDAIATCGQSIHGTSEQCGWCGATGTCMPKASGTCGAGNADIKGANSCNACQCDTHTNCGDCTAFVGGGCAWCNGKCVSGYSDQTDHWTQSGSSSCSDSKNQCTSATFAFGAGNCPDSTAPVWTSGYPVAPSSSDDAITLKMHVNEASTVYWIVYRFSASPCASSFYSSATVKTMDATGCTYFVSGGTESAAANTERVRSATGLAAGTAYTICLVAEDAKGNLQSAPTCVQRSTTDTTAPVLTSIVPSVSASESTCPVQCKLDEAGTCYVAIELAGYAGARSPATIKTAAEGATYKKVGQVSVVNANSYYNINLAGLAPGTSYTVWVAGEDKHSNYVAAADKKSCKTSDETPPTFEVLTVTSAAETSALLNVQLSESGKVYYKVVARGAACTDTPSSWTANNGKTCQEYADNKWCTPEGSYGPGWPWYDGSGGTTSRSFSYYAKDGVDATQACCACGAWSLHVKNGATASTTSTTVASTKKTLSLSGLAETTAFDLWAVGEDLASPSNNLMASPTTVQFATVDTTPPILTVIAVKADFSETSIQVEFSLSENGNVHLVVVERASSTGAPTSAQVKAGTDAEGNTPKWATTSIYSTACTDAPSDWSSCGRGGVGSSGGVGKTCNTYETSNWCVPDGGRVDPVGGGGNYGTSWNFDTMKTFEDYAGPCPDREGGDKAGGMGANQACCACGGGVRTSTKAVLASPAQLKAKISYDLYIVAEDAANNIQSTPKKFQFTMPDLTAPTLTLTSLVDIKEKDATLQVTMNEAGSVFVSVQTVADYNSPTVAVIIGGTAVGGTGGGEWTVTGAATPASKLLCYSSANCLSGATSYKVCVVGRDLAGNTQSSATCIDLTTVDGTPPIVTGMKTKPSRAAPSAAG